MNYATRKQMTRNAAVNFHTRTLTTDTVLFEGFRLTGGTAISTTASTAASVAFQHDMDDKIGFIVSWCATLATTAAITLTVSQGSVGRAWNRDQGDYVFYPAGAATGSTSARVGKRWLVGPFESARFAVKSTSTNWEGRNEVKLTLAAATDAAYESSDEVHRNRADVVAFRMPTVAYSS